MKLKRIYLFEVLYLSVYLRFGSCQTGESTGQTNVNILVLYNEEDYVALNGIEAATRFLSQRSNENVKVANKYLVAIKDGTEVENTVNSTCDIIDRAIGEGQPPHVVLDATRTGLISETSKTFTRVLALPTFSSSYGQEGDLREWRNLSEEEKKYLVQLMPPSDIIVQSIRDIVRTQNVSNAAVIYDDTFVMDHKYKSLLQNLPCRHIMVMVKPTEKERREQMKKLMDVGIVYYFAVGSLQTIRNVLEAATANMMFGRKYSWYALTKDVGDLGCGCDNSTVVFLSPFQDKETKVKLDMLERNFGLDGIPKLDAAFYFDFALRGIKAAGSMIKEGKYANFEFVRCSSFDESNPPVRQDFDFKSALQAVQMDPTWSLIMWGENGMTFPEVDLTMTRITLIRGKVAQSSNLGQWDAGMPGTIMFTSGLDLNEHQAVTVYRVVIVQQPPFVMKKKTEDGKEIFVGYCIDLINEIKQIMKFEYELFEAPDGIFGNMNENMEWNGMIKELIEKRADIALGSISVMAERENVIDFTVPYYDLVGITIMMLKPKTPTSLFKFLTVLEAEVWICILAAYVFTSLLLWLFDWFSPYSYQNNKEKYKDDDEKREFSLKECLWFCMTSLTPQGGGEAPKNLSGRLVAATWWLFGFIIIASYTANLAAFLTVSRLDTPIESLTDLSNQYKIQYAPMNGSSTMTYFERMAGIEDRFYEIWKDMSLDDTMNEVERAKLAVWDYPVSDKYTKMWQSMQEAGLPKTFEDALERVRASKSSSEGFAYLGDATDIRYQVLTNCDLQIVGEEFSRKPYALAVQQGSPLKDQLNDAILKLLNQRKLETLKERWWNQNPEKKECEEEDDQSEGISIENIGGVFIVIFVGIGLACITLAFEYWWYKGGRATRVTDSSRVVSVKEFAPPKKDKDKFAIDKSNFDTEYKSRGFAIASVPNPW
ncbi:UNVERIFIED_CONTAM: hypothetical protein RMT77_003468 [Armadillidium vulgare]